MGYEAKELDKLISTVRQKYGLPALGVLIAQGQNAPLVAMNGVRVLDGNQRVGESDMWFLGSTAKATTATLMATFVIRTPWYIPIRIRTTQRAS